MSNYSEKGSEVRYQLLDDGTFVIENYNLARPFASFFPGIAGLNGIPLWAFYVNRNQGITSFGIKNKNYSLMEFYPANNAYGLVPNLGFRTFIKLRKNGKKSFYEPFTLDPAGASQVKTQKMLIRAYEVIFEEANETLGIKTTVKYFTLPQEPIAALVRIVTLENIGGADLDMEVIDGLPKIIPYWMSADVLKSMSYTAQAWTTVTNFKSTGIPFYRLKVEISDKPEVYELRKGNFYFGLTGDDGALSPAAAVIDPEVIFGADTSLGYPYEFMKDLDFVLPEKQVGDNKYPSAMSFFRARLSPGSSRELYSMAGHIESEEALNAYVHRASSVQYFSVKSKENRDAIENLTAAIMTESGERTFDLYCRQTYLDNLLRGGTPIKLPAGDRDMVYYVYSRKHGDLERDYNNFQLSPSFYSQGNGNYRDMNQNKRNDIFFNPWIRDFNVIGFYNLLQLDGYNPLLVKGYSFFFNVKGKDEQKFLKKAVEKNSLQKVQLLFARHFEPGDILLGIEEKNIRLKISPDDFLRQVLGLSESLNDAEHLEGFWVDHWTYNLDLLENYLAVYPEKEREILLEKKDFTFYDNPNIVVPRSEKHVDAKGKIRQFDAVVLNTVKARLLRERENNVHVVRTKKGKGTVYRTTLAAKMISLVLNKLSTLDSEGIGIEMEAEKPGWYDALNGLPGIFGSSVCETFELKRQVQFLLWRLASLDIKDDYRFLLAEEISVFFRRLDALLERRKKLTSFAFWDQATTLKEEFRHSTLMGVSGKEKPITCAELKGFLQKALEKLNEGLAKAKDKKTGLYYTYLSYEAAACRRTKKVSHHGWPCVQITKFKKKPLPLFLEAEVHYMKTENDAAKVRAFHRSLKGSDLYDAQLKMYKVNASLKGQSTDLGRCTVFAPGWLENESVWLHMEYKYLLELLKAGLYDEFFTEFRNAGICFQDPKVYGRSILENSSFIASSAFPDSRIWGRGYVARLSGSTAEFLSMWMLMTQGDKPFRLSVSGELELHLKPVLPGSFFGENGMFSFTFLGTTAVRYNNPQRIDTYAAGIKKIDIEWNDGAREMVNGGIIVGKLAEKIRNGEAKRIDAAF